MTITQTVFCAVLILLCVVEAIAFFKQRTLFRNLSQFITGAGVPLFAGGVAFNLGYVLGAIDQNLAIPGARFSIVDDMKGPIPEPAVFCLLALVTLTLVLRSLDEWRRRKTQ